MEQPEFSPRLVGFEHEGKVAPVSFLETQAVKEGVTADLYEFTGDRERDLAIITVRAGVATPLQRVVLGDQTLEGYYSGKGTLSVESGGETKVYEFPNESEGREVSVAVGDTMQWQAAEDADLVFYEICYPPYADGRFENLKP